jgi:hypothetical protein
MEKFKFTKKKQDAKVCKCMSVYSISNSLNHQNVMFVLPVHVFHCTPIFISDPWGDKAQLLA